MLLGRPCSPNVLVVAGFRRETEVGNVSGAGLGDGIRVAPIIHFDILCVDYGDGAVGSVMVLITWLLEGRLLLGFRGCWIFPVGVPAWCRSCVGL